MSDYRTVTSVNAIVVNEFTEEEADTILEARGEDSLEDLLDEMSEEIEAVIAHRVFPEADEIGVLNVNVELEDVKD